MDTTKNQLLPLFAGLASCLSLGCTTELHQPLEPNGDQQEIVGGVVEAGYPAVGSIVVNNSHYCTATVVAPRVILSAAHCFTDQASDPSQVSFFISDGAETSERGGSGRTIAITSIHAHPDYDDENIVNDIAMAVLAEPAGVQPIPYLTTTMDASFVGTNPLFIGYGRTSGTTDDYGQKRSVEIEITSVDDKTFRYEGKGRNTCNGDSGGPALLEVNGVVQVLGVTSYGDVGCTQYGYNTRTDRFVGFLDGVVSLAGGDPQQQETETTDETETDEPTQPEQDPEQEDLCALWGYYGDGYCDPGCLNPDPDCGVETGPSSSDICEANGWYGDGICDPFCENPDADCAMGSGQGLDMCEFNDWYGDGICDPYCATPDPDCAAADGWW